MELEKYHGWVDDAQDNVYARSEDVRLTLSPTVAEAAHKSLRIRARSSSRLTVPELKQLLDYLGCGAEVQNYDRASLTVKVTMHRDGTVLTLPLEMVGRNEERCPWLKKLKADEFPKPEPAPGAAGAMPAAGMYGAYPQMMMGGYPQQMIMQQQMMYQQQMAYQQQMMAAGYGYPAQQQQQQAAPPAAAAAPALPAGWTSAVDPSSGRTYYCNTATKQTTWEHPAAPAQPAAATSPTASAGSPTAAAATASSTPAAGAPAAAATSGDAAATAPAAAAPAAPAPTPAPLPEVRTS